MFAASVFNRPACRVCGVTMGFLAVLLVLGQARDVDAADTRRNFLYWPAEQTSVTVPLEFGGNLLFAKVTINQKPAGWFMIDTGAGYLAIDDDVADELNLPKTGKAEAIGIAGSQPATIRRINSLSLAAAGEKGRNGQVSLRNRNILATDFAKWSDVLGVKVSGVLGYDLWNQVPFTLDYQAATVTFHDPKSFKPAAPVHLEKLVFVKKRPHISGWVNQQHEGMIMLDTGVQAALHVDREFLLAHRELQKIERPTTTETVGIGGSTRLLEGTFDQLYFLATQLNDVRVGLPVLKHERESNAKQDAIAPVREIEGRTVVQAKPLIGKPRQAVIGIMGGRLLKRFRLTFDYRNDRLIAERVQKAVPSTIDHASRVDFLGWPPLVLAANDGDLERVEALLMLAADQDEKLDVNLTNRDGNTALRIACERGYVRTIASLLVSKADPNVANKIGETAVHPVCEAGALGVLRALIQSGAKVDIKAKNGATPLRLAAQNGHAAVVKLLLANAARVDEPDAKGQSPLMAAAANGHEATALALLAAGADINHRDELKQTPLMFAAQAGQTRVVDVMLTRGADVNAVSRAGLTALKLATEHRRTATAALLRRQGAGR